VTTVSLDASTILAWAKKERGWRTIDGFLRDPKGARLVLPGTALTEVITVLRLQPGATTMTHQAIATSVLGQGIDLETMSEQDHVRAAELIEISRANAGPPVKAGGPPSTLSLSDASIIAVSERLEANVLTGDQHWADLSEDGHLKVKAILFPRS
jgi:PIN domain nuclease of toxin-antitoxin system